MLCHAHRSVQERCETAEANFGAINSVQQEKVKPKLKVKVRPYPTGDRPIRIPSLTSPERSAQTHPCM